VLAHGIMLELNKKKEVLAFETENRSRRSIAWKGSRCILVFIHSGIIAAMRLF